MQMDTHGAFMWAFLMVLLLGVQWWSFGESKDPRRVAFDKLSAEEQTRVSACRKGSRTSSGVDTGAVE